jgi:putative dehydrogenase
METTPDVGMVGLGIMGTALSRNMMATGLSVVGYDIEDEAMARFEDGGGIRAGSPGEAAGCAPIVLLSLPSITALREVVADISASGSPGCIIVECGTLPINEKQAAHDTLARKGITLLDCPLSGTGAQAAVRDLVVFASGELAAVQTCQPVLDAIARQTQYLGEFGNGMKMKLVANLLVSIHNAATAEAIVLARKAGLDARTTYEVLGASAASSRMFEVRGSMMVERVYEPATMKLDVWRKDLELITAFATDLDCPTPLFSASEALYARTHGKDMGALDTACINTVLEEMAGISVEE